MRPPAAGAYHFRATGENALRVWLDGRPVVDEWDPGRGGMVNRTFDADLTAGPHALRIELSHGARGPALVTLSWSRPGGFAERPVSAAYLFPDAAAARAAEIPADPRPADEEWSASAPAGVEFTCVASSTDSRSVAAGTTAGRGYVWEAATGRLVAETAAAHPRAVASVACDGTRLFTAGVHDTLAVWDLPTGRLAGRVPLYPGDSRVAMSPGGNSFATVTEDHKLRVWDARTRAEREVVAIDFLLRSLRWEAGGELVVTGDGGSVVRYRPGTAAPRRTAVGAGRMALAAAAAGVVTAEEYRGRGNQGVLRLTDAATGGRAVVARVRGRGRYRGPVPGRPAARVRRDVVARRRVAGRAAGLRGGVRH